jgi:hypothetical protein
MQKKKKNIEKQKERRNRERGEENKLYMYICILKNL